MAGPIKFLGKLNSGMNRLTVYAVCIAVVATIAAAAWLLHTVKASRLTLDNDNSIDCTPTIIERVRGIGQWEFLAINDEEIIDTTRTGFFSDDELVRIYYGTLRIGIDLRGCSADWIRTEKDTVFVTVPEVQLLDYNFIDEARTRSFFETGKWSNADRAALYTRARQIMKRRCLSASNLRSAELNATTQFGHIMRSMGFANVRVRVSRTDKRNNK